MEASFGDLHEKRLRPEARLVDLDLEDPRWCELVASDPGSFAFHEPGWAATIAECYGCRAFGLALADGAGRLKAGLPVVETGHHRLARARWVSLPFSDVCPVLLAPDADLSDAADLAEAADARRASAGIREFELRSPSPAGGGQGRVAGVIHVLELAANHQELFRAAKGSIRQGIRAAERAGVSVRRDASREALTQTFYDLHVRTRRRLGVPVQDRRFFEVLWRRVIEPGGGFVLIAEQAEKPVAAAVFLTSASRVTYKYGASDDRAWSLRPNNALFWHAIRWSCERGYRQFDFGRSDLDAEGLRRFKSSWGAEETPLVYSTFGESSRREPTKGQGPARRLATQIIRRSPPFVCRAAGNLLYRYTA